MTCVMCPVTYLFFKFYLFSTHFKMQLTYRDKYWPYRFRVVEFICCMSLLVFGILLLIFKTQLKLFIVVPVLVCSSAFSLICLYSLSGFGTQQTQAAYRSWIAFATAGMALFFLASGFLIIPTRYLYHSKLLSPTISLAILLGIVFLLDILFMIRHIHKQIIPKGVFCPGMSGRSDRESRSTEAQTGFPLTVCSICKQQECTVQPKPEEVKIPHCQMTKRESIPGTSLGLTKPDVASKSVQMSVEPINDLKIMEYPLPYAAKRICNSEGCKDKQIIDKNYKFNEYEGSIKKVPEPEMLPNSCAPDYCRINPLQVSKSIQVTPEATPVTSKTSKLFSRIPLKMCEKNECPKNCKTTLQKIPRSKENFKFIKSSKVSPLVPEIRTEQTYLQKCVKGKICNNQNCKANNCLNEEVDEKFVQKINYGPISSKIQASKISSNTSMLSVGTASRRNTGDSLERVVIDTSQVKTSSKSLQTSNFTMGKCLRGYELLQLDKSIQVNNSNFENIKPDRFGPQKSHSVFNMSEEYSTQTSTYQQHRVESFKRTTNCQTYNPPTIEKEPIIIVLKEYQGPSCRGTETCSPHSTQQKHAREKSPKDASNFHVPTYQNRTNTCSPQSNQSCREKSLKDASLQITDLNIPPYQNRSNICSPQSNQIKRNREEPLKDISLQITDFYETKDVPIFNQIPVMEEPESDVSFHPQADENTQFSNTLDCACKDRTVSDDGICFKCCKRIREELAQQNIELQSRPQFVRGSILDQQPYAYSPKRNGLDNDDMEPTPIYKYNKNKISKRFEDSRQTYSAKSDQRHYRRSELSRKSGEASLPTSANYQRDSVRKVTYEQ